MIESSFPCNCLVVKLVPMGNGGVEKYLNNPQQLIIMVEIQVKEIEIARNKFIDNNIIIQKKSNESITIGRLPENDIHFDIPILSRTHGRIFLEKGFFSEHLDYEDYSSQGTKIISWWSHSSIKQLGKGDKEKIRPGDWIIIYYKEGPHSSLMTGILLIPSIV